MQPASLLARQYSVGTVENEMGDRRFADFYVFDYPRLVSAIRLITGDADSARDAVDEACARAWERIDRGQSIDVLGAWVRVVALNQARGRIRRRASERRTIERLAAMATQDVPDAMARAGDALDIHRVLAALPRRQREVVVLYYFLDQSVDRIADELEIPVGTVKAALHRARAALATQLDRGPTRPERTPS
jgi:RNA polymerase sigma-70 factor (ECF subfamily)